MRWTTLLIALVLTGGAPQGKPAHSDLEKLHGVWTCVSMERNGAPLPAKRYRGGRLIMEGDRFRYEQDGKLVTAGVRKLDPSRSPKEVDDTHTAGPFKGKTYLGIYELEGDVFKTCNGSAGQARPTEFATKPGSGLLLIVYKREKPPSKP